MLHRRLLLAAGVLLLTVQLAQLASADPCGMVPPIYTGDGPAITRVGIQKTYVFYRNGVETFVIRPGFTGKVEEFGMLIPFPSVPAMRKVDDDTFAHIAAAIDPPEVVINLIPLPQPSAPPTSGAARPTSAENGLKVEDQVRVIKEEAIGMYEVVVLEAGSPAALKKWMDGHGYHYPTGMDKACGEYVAAGWCFVAVKTRVSKKSAVDPQAGMRNVDPGLGPNGTFDGNVQAMGFRFAVPELVVPMRLSSFNAGELHNIVYLLTDQPMNIRNTPTGHVRRQVSGAELHRNITGLLPLRIIGGTVADLSEETRKQADDMRQPGPVNGLARELFAFDLLASVTGNLSHPHEEREKQLLNIAEALDLRGPEIDALNHASLAELRKKAGESALGLLKTMTLTIWDGEFEREMLARENLSFVSFNMPAAQNTLASYNAVEKAELGDWANKLSTWQGWRQPMMQLPGTYTDGNVTRTPVAKAAGSGEMPPPGGDGEISLPIDDGKEKPGPTFADVPITTKIWLAMGGGALLLTIVML
ncbi:MAG: DUF2330 domain-containing protein, partial [Planctomycetota bacterium]